jgi:hypothetical protein
LLPEVSFSASSSEFSCCRWFGRKNTTQLLGAVRETCETYFQLQNSLLCNACWFSFLSARSLLNEPAIWIALINSNAHANEGRALQKALRTAFRNYFKEL